MSGGATGNNKGDTASQDACPVGRRRRPLYPLASQPWAYASVIVQRAGRQRRPANRAPVRQSSVILYHVDICGSMDQRKSFDEAVDSLPGTDEGDAGVVQFVGGDGRGHVHELGIVLGLLPFDGEIHHVALVRQSQAT